MAQNADSLLMYSNNPQPRILAAKFRIKYRDIFSMKNLYMLIHEWIVDNDWKDAKKHEPFYGQRTDANKVKEIWIWWKIHKESESKYYEYHMKFNFHCLGMKPKEIMHEGKKLKVDDGEVELAFKSWIEFKEDEWDKHWLLKNFKDMYRKRIFHKNIEDHKRNLYRETFKLQGIIKRYLNMKGFMSELELEPFHPSYSWP